MAEDIPPLKQLCYRVATLKHGLTPEEIKDLILTTSQKKKGDNDYLEQERSL